MLMKRAALTMLDRMQRLLDRQEGTLDHPRWHMGANEYAALRAEHGSCLTHALRIPIVIMPDLIGIGLHARRDEWEPW